MKFKKLIGALGLALAAVHSFAGPALVTDGGVSVLEDDNKEYVLNSEGELKTSGPLVAGDVLVAVVKFNSVLTSTNAIFDVLGAGNAVYGISAIEVASIDGSLATFKPFAAFEGTYGAGAMAALFTGPTVLDMACPDAATCEAFVTSGDPWMTVGFGDADDFWIAGGAAPFSILTPLQTLATTAAGTKVAVANYALSILENNTGYLFEQQVCDLCVAPGGDGMVDIIGSGDILGGRGLTGEYIARSDFDFELVARVPEPGTLALLGASLLAAGGASARRRKAK